jgi:hypothetical protein
MTESETPGAAHEAFNALCDGLEDYEPLPTRTSGADSSRTTAGSNRSEDSSSIGSSQQTDGSDAERSGSPATGSHLDAEILAGLVNP